MRELYKPGQRVPGSRLTVIKEATPRKSKHYFLCQCDCGSEPKEIQYEALRIGHTKSCGCLRREAVSKPVNPESLKVRRAQKFKRAKPKNNTSGVKGVSYLKAVKKYKAAIIVNGKQFYGGVYPTVEEAAAARKALEINKDNLS